VSDIEIDKPTHRRWGFVVVRTASVDRHAYGDEENDKDPDKRNNDVGDNELVFELPPHDDNDCVDCDGLNLQIFSSIYHTSFR